MAQGSPKSVQFGGVQVAAGLNWVLKGSKTADFGKGLPWRERISQIAKTLKPESRRGVSLQWDNRIATAEDTALEGTAALAQVVAGLLPDALSENVVMVAIADIEQDLFTSFVLAAGRPVIGQEEVFKDRATLLNHCRVNLAAGREIDAVFASADLVPDLAGRFEVEAFPDEIDIEARELARFRKTQTASPLLIGAVVATAGVGIFVFAGPSIFGGASHAPAGPAPTAERVDWSAFVQTCVGALDQRWPLLPGWDIASSGCTAPPSGAVGTQGQAWKTFVIRSGHNITIASRVAQAVYADWPSPIQVTGDRLTVSQPLKATWQPVAASHQPAAPEGKQVFQRDVAGAFLGIMSAGAKPIATANMVRGQHVTVTVSAGIPDALQRFLRIPGAALIKVTNTGAFTQVIVAPVGSGATLPKNRRS